MLHLVIMALGGWALGRSLKLHAGAVLLGLLMGASGGFTTALNRGFYQIGFSLAYMAWVYAGLIGLLYREQTRRWLGVLVVALILMLFAGSYWYVVPVLIGARAIALFALIKPESARNPRAAFQALGAGGRVLHRLRHALADPALEQLSGLSSGAGLRRRDLRSGRDSGVVLRAR